MDYVEKFFKKTGYLSIIESLVSVIIGLILVYHPEGTLKTIALILGIAFITMGIYKIILYFATKKEYNFTNYNLIYGIMMTIIGIVVIAYSNIITSIFRILIGIWILYSALVRMNLSVKLKTLNLNVWIISLILALIMFGCGIYVIANSGAIIVSIGIAIIIFAVMDIIENIIFIKNVNETF